MGHPPEQDAIIAAQKAAEAEGVARPAAKRRPSARKKAAVARTEKAPEPKTVDFRSVTITLPDVLPGDLYFSFADFAESGETPATQVRLLKSLIGEDHTAQVRAKVSEDRIPLSEMEDVLAGLVNAILDVYGMAAGESEASPSS